MRTNRCRISCNNFILVGVGCAIVLCCISSYARLGHGPGRDGPGFGSGLEKPAAENLFQALSVGLESSYFFLNMSVLSRRDLFPSAEK